jgi:hypothetical protein
MNCLSANKERLGEERVEDCVVNGRGMQREKRKLFLDLFDFILCRFLWNTTVA